MAVSTALQAPYSFTHKLGMSATIRETFCEMSFSTLREHMGHGRS